jgi:predicted DCC family thiol-disulfide oxidoreductase YuxK
MNILHPSYPLTLLYDASCPVCRLEMDELRHRNQHGLLVFVDISAPDFDLARHWPAALDANQARPSFQDMNAALHGIGADGLLYTGVETIRLAYAAVGLGWLWAPTRWPLLRSVSDVAYRWFARHRYQISAHLAPLVNRIEQRRAQSRMSRMQRCHDGHCEM